MITIRYKQVSGVDLHFNAHAPSTVPNSIHGKDGENHVIQAPAVVFFHGGGLTVGNRASWFPEWMHGEYYLEPGPDVWLTLVWRHSDVVDRFSEKGYLFVSAEYRLIPPSTGHDIIEDVQDLWAYLTDSDLVFAFSLVVDGALSTRRLSIDRERIVLAGSSAGGLCAYLCALHCRAKAPHLPRPKAILSLYAMGGDFITWHYLTHKTDPFFKGREILDPMDPELQPYVFNMENNGAALSALAVTADSPLSYHPQSYRKPGYPANPRMLLARLYKQLGTYLDYYTGEHEPSLSAQLRFALEENGREAVLEHTPPASEPRLSSDNAPGQSTLTALRIIVDQVMPPRHLGLFPQFVIDKARDWPSTLFLHGTADTAVDIEESRHLCNLLQDQQVKLGGQDGVRGRRFRLVEVPGEEHSFDLLADAGDKWRAQFDAVVEFVHSAVEALVEM